MYRLSQQSITSHNFVKIQSSFAEQVLRTNMSPDMIHYDNPTKSVSLPRGKKNTYPPGSDHISPWWALLSRWFSELPIWWDMWSFPGGYPSSHNHGSVENGCISNITFLSLRAIFHFPALCFRGQTGCKEQSPRAHSNLDSEVEMNKRRSFFKAKTTIWECICKLVWSWLILYRWWFFVHFSGGKYVIWMFGFNLYSEKCFRKRGSLAIQGNSTTNWAEPPNWTETFHFGCQFVRKVPLFFEPRRLSMPIHQIGNRKMVEPLPFIHTRKEWRVVHLLTLLDFEVDGLTVCY